MRTIYAYLLAFACFVSFSIHADWERDLAKLPQYESQSISTDWLLDSSPYQTRIFKNGTKELVLTNGLISRTFRLSPNAATVSIRNDITQASLLRGVKPEAKITLDGQEYSIGGLTGQPNYAYLLPEWK